MVHHCNLSCRGCSHLSPLLPEHFESPDGLFHDLSYLAGYCRPGCISLLGGEPLLHPHLLRIIDAVRESRITGWIRVVTNGLLLDQMPERFWESVDEVHVSLYPWNAIKKEELAMIKTRARKGSTVLGFRYQNHFREIFCEQPNMDAALVRRIYRTCHMSHDDCCHTLEGGRYYKCPPAALIPLVRKDDPKTAGAADGIDIRSSQNPVEDLAAYFSSQKPLAACRYCLGSAGKQFIPALESRKHPSRPVSWEDLIDWQRLEKLDAGKGLAFPISPHWTSEKVNRMIARLPSSILLSAPLRRATSALSNCWQKYFHGA